ncbi:MAG: glycosyltransferase family 2 protein [Ignavibacteriaceae bacterium]
MISMDLSIIIVNYNSFQILTECLDSIYKFTDKQTIFEIILVDNNSNEGDIRDILRKYPQINLIVNKENRGFSAANNQGLEVATGKYILFLNNDTLFIEDTINKTIAFLEDFGKDSVIGCRLLNANKSLQPSVVDKDTLGNSFGENLFLYRFFKGVKKLNKYYYSDNEPQQPTKVDIVKGAFILCSKKIVDELYGFDARFFFYAEETDFCMRAADLGYNVVYFPQTEIIHLGGVATDKNLWFKFKNQSIAKIQIYQKHFKGMEFFLLVALHFTGMFLRVFVYLGMSISKLKLDLIKKSFLYLRLLFIYPKNQFKRV